MASEVKTEEKEVIANGLNEEANEIPQKVSDIECLEAKVQDGGNTSGNTSVAVTEEQNESSGVAAVKTSLGEGCKEEAPSEGVVKVTGSEAEEPDDSAPPSAPSDDKEKTDNEQKNVSGKQRRGGRNGKNALMKELASLKLPDGIILVKDRRYTGYHCTFCNCVLKSLTRMKAHVGGRWHRGTLRVKMVKEKKKKIASPSKSSGPPNEKVLPKEPLKSSLQEFLSTTKARIVGLSYVIETQRPNKDPTFQCNLCEVSCDSSDIKDHILGMKHCLMYSKLVKPAKLAELLAKQLTKAEKNKEIAKLSEELEKENGRGEITVKFLQTKSTAGQRPRNRNSERGRPGNRLPNRLQQSSGNRAAPGALGQNRNRNPRVTRRNVPRPQQKRRNDGMSPAKKRQLLERDFQARLQYSRQSAQSNFSGWGMGRKPVDMVPYENDAGFYPKYSSFPRDSYGERSFNQQYMNDRYRQVGQFSSREMPYRERYDDRQSYWNDRHDNYTSNKPSSYSDRAVSSARGERYSKGSDDHISALKHLAGLNVTTEEDAGVVINAINSLTNSVMNYKLRDLSQPVQQLLQKSLESNDLKSLLDLPDRPSGGSRDRYGGRSSRMDQNWGITQIAKPKNWLF